MSITKGTHNRRSAEARRCPSCGRGQAITNAADGTRYCRWSDCANDYAANRRLVPLSDTPHEKEHP